MICRDAQALLPAHIDRELDVATSLQIEAHLAACRECAAADESAQALRAAIGSTALAYTPPPELAARIRAAVAREARPRAAQTRRPWRWTAIPAAAAIAATLSWFVAVNTMGTGGEQRVLDDLIAGHVRSLMVDHLVDVPSSDQHTVRPWFNGKIDFAPPVADYAASGFPLVGGRVDYIGGRTAAAVVYRREQHSINVFVWPTSGPEVAPQEVSSQGYHLLHWSKAGLDYWAVSDLNTRELRLLAEQIRQSQS